MKRTTAQRTAEEPQESKPMDSGIIASTVPPTFQSAADCYAIDTLVGEVAEVFPDATYETHTVNGWQTARGVTFQNGEPGLHSLLSLITSDERVEAVEATGAGNSRVIFLNDPTKYDLRDPFGLVEAYTIIEEDDGDEASDD